MATIRDLKDAVKETLSKSGTLSEIRARIRAEIFHTLQEDSEPPPPLSNENIIINELIREYLVFNGYMFTESVLVAESGQPQFQFQRELIEEQLKLKSHQDSKHLPLLYGLVQHFSKGSKASSLEKQPSAQE